MKFLLVLGFALALASANDYDGYKLYELTTQTPTAQQLVQSLIQNSSAYEFVAAQRAQQLATLIRVSPTSQSTFQAVLDREAIDFKVLDGDVGSTLRNEYITNRALRERLPYHGRLSTERYYTYAEINQYLEDLAKKYTNRVFLKTVGKTFEGRWLKTLKITNGDGRRNKNVIVMDGGIHAREWISPAAVIYIIEQLVEHFEDNAELLQDYDWIVLPVINADGYEYTQQSENTRFWRKTRKPTSENCIGTDPNRNFGYHWAEEGASPNPCSDTYAGAKPFSEPETAVVRDVLHSYAARGQMYLTLHSFGSYILYPWGYAAILPDNVDDLHEVAAAGQEAIKAATGREYTIGCSAIELYAAAGASDDYAHSIGYPISFTMELPGDGSNGFNPPATSIDNLVKETWVGVRAMTKKVVEKYPLN